MRPPCWATTLCSTRSEAAGDGSTVEIVCGSAPLGRPHLVHLRRLSLPAGAGNVVAWVWHPPYSVIRNSISDLGNTSCGRYGASPVCSPRHALMNAAFIFLGLVLVAGSVRISQGVARPLDRKRYGTSLEAAPDPCGSQLVCLVPDEMAIVVGSIQRSDSDAENTVAVLGVSPLVQLPQVMFSIDCGQTNWKCWWRTRSLVIASRRPQRRSFDAASSALSRPTALILFACHRDVCLRRRRHGAPDRLPADTAAPGSGSTDCTRVSRLMARTRWRRPAPRAAVRRSAAAVVGAPPSDRSTKNNSWAMSSSPLATAFSAMAVTRSCRSLMVEDRDESSASDGIPPWWRMGDRVRRANLTPASEDS